MMEYFNRRPAAKNFGNWPFENVWLGVSVENQATADERIPLLLETPAAVRWVSYEPALGPVDFKPWLWPRCRRCGGSMSIPAPGGGMPCPSCLNHQGVERGIDWIVCGGESGPGARPFDLAWAHSVIEQGKAAGVPIFVKQLGARQLLDGVPRSEAHRVKSRKGGDMAEWPPSLRVREFPR